jgi:hypothetical protein
VCGLRNPEDLAFAAAAGILLVSQLADPAAPGSLAALAVDAAGDAIGAPARLWPDAGAAPEPDRGDPGCPGPPDPERFAPHGIALAPAAPRLAVVNHGGRESVELFELEGSGGGARLRWRGCVPLPADASGNDVVLDAEGGLFVTSYAAAAAGPRALASEVIGGLGLATGHVFAWRPGSGWRALAGSAGALPNGVALARDGRSVWSARTGSGDVAQHPLDGAPARALPVEGRPDNLAWDASGALLAVTHLSGLEVALCAWGRRPCRSDWALVAIDPRAFSARVWLRHDGERLGGATSVAQVRGRYYFGAAHGDRIGVWWPPGR